MPSAHRLLAPLLAALVLPLGACTDRGAGTSSSEGSRTLTVLAAASLRVPFTRLGRAFEQAHPGTRVTFSFAGSSDLVAQLDQGAPGDVLATADERTMRSAQEHQAVTGSPRVVATNRLTLVTPPDDPRHVASLADLGRPDVQAVVCAPQVPCGAAARVLARAAGVALHPVSEEQSVTDVLGKVTAGQADAGLVYATDATGAGGSVRTVPLPEAAQVVNRYPVAAVATAPHPDDARAFVDLVAGPTGQAVLQQAGFGRP